MNTPADLGPVEMLKAKINEVRADRETIKSSKAAWTAVERMHKLESDLLGELRTLQAAASSTAPTMGEGMTDDELVAVMLASMAELPSHLIDRIWKGLAERRPGLRVVS